MTLYQAHDVLWKKLDGTLEKYNECTIIVNDESGAAEVNILGNPVPGNQVPVGNGATQPSPIDKIDFVTHISRLDFRVS